MAGTPPAPRWTLPLPWGNFARSPCRAVREASDARPDPCKCVNPASVQVCVDARPDPCNVLGWVRDWKSSVFPSSYWWSVTVRDLTPLIVRADAGDPQPTRFPAPGAGGDRSLGGGLKQCRVTRLAMKMAKPWPVLASALNDQLGRTGDVGCLRILRAFGQGFKHVKRRSLGSITVKDQVVDAKLPSCLIN